MFYSQIVMQEGIPLDLHVRNDKALFLNELSEEEIDNLLIESLESIKKDRTYSLEEVEDELKRKYGN